MAQLVLIRNNGDEGAAYKIEKQSVIIGRAKKSDIAIRLPTISRQHARIDNEKENGHVFLNALTKKNPMYVNNEVVNGKCQLFDGDIIMIGPRKYLFRDTSCSRKTGKGATDKPMKKVRFQSEVTVIKPAATAAPKTPMSVMRNIDEASFTPMIASKSEPSKLATPTEGVRAEPAKADSASVVPATPVPTMVEEVGFNSSQCVTPVPLHSTASDLLGVPFLHHLGVNSPLEAHTSSPLTRVCDDDLLEFNADKLLRATTPGQSRNITWGMLFERQLAESEELLRNSAAIEACAAELLKDILPDEEAIEPCTPVKSLDEDIANFCSIDANLTPVSGPGHAHEKLDFAHMECARESEISRPQDVSPGPGRNALLGGETARAPHTPLPFPTIEEIKRTVFTRSIEVDAVSMPTIASPLPIKVIDATSPHVPHVHADHTAASPTVRLALSKGATSTDPSKPSSASSNMSPGGVQRSIVSNNVSSPDVISRHFPSVGALKRASNAREGASLPSASSAMDVTTSDSVSGEETTLGSQRNVSFGAVSIHSFPLHLDVVEGDQMNLHMRLGDAERKSRKLSVDDHESERTSQRSNHKAAASSDAKFYGRTPILERFDRVRRSLIGASDREQKIEDMRNRISVFLAGMTRRDLQSLAKEHGIRANLKTSKLVSELTKVYTQIDDGSTAQEMTTTNRNTASNESDDVAKPVASLASKESEEDSEAAKVLAECESWSRRTLQKWCKKVGIKANSKTVVLIRELKAHYTRA